MNNGERKKTGNELSGEFKGGTILGVGVTVEKAQYLDMEKVAVVGSPWAKAIEEVEGAMNAIMAPQ